MTEKKGKVILVEDDSAIVDIYRTVMKKSHFDVEVMNTGMKAIEMIKEIEAGKKEKPDIIILDLILPDIDGTEVLKKIRQNNSTKDIIVFILTNKEDTKLQELGDIRPDEYLIKANVTPTQILELIKKRLYS